MKPVSRILLRSLGAILIGVILICFPKEAGNYLIITLGAVFMVPSLISLVSTYVKRKEGEFPVPIAAIGGMLFGLILIVMPEFFASFLSIVLGFFIVLGSVGQVAKLLEARNQDKSAVPMGYFVLPVLVFLAGIFALINPLHFEALILVIIGICCLLYGCVELMGYIKFARKVPSEKEPSWEPGDVEVQEMQEAQEVSDETPLLEEMIQDAEIVDDEPDDNPE